MKAPKVIYISQLFLPDFSESTVKMVKVKSMPDLTDIKYLSEEYLNQMLSEKDKDKDKEIERLKNNEVAYKNRIRILEKFIPKSDTNVVEDSSFKAIPTCKNCGNLFNDTDMQAIESLPENICVSCFTSNA